MGAMKAIYTDIQELQEAAERDEDGFISYIEEVGWVSPTESEIRKKRIEEGMKILSESDKLLVQSFLAKAGMDISPVDFPIRSAVPALVSA